MNPQASHKCLIIQDSETDYVFGSASGLEFKAVLQNPDWSGHIDFFERQKFGWESDACVLFSAQESFDAQINNLIEQGAFPQSAIDAFYSLGFMQASTIDNGQPRFHSSARFLHVQAGTRHNGTPLQSPWDIMRKQGVLPWTDLPFDETTSETEYFSAIPLALLDKAKKILPFISVQYQWIAKGGTGTPITKMKNALTQAPLCIGVNTCDNWNQVQPTACSSIAPEHSVMVYLEDTLTHCLDHYLPFEKQLPLTYSIPYVFQGIINVVPQSPPPPPPPPPQVSNPPTLEQKQAVSSWLDIISQWLKNLLSNLH
jgi:hypothetical protein